ncbi:unnamed protein product [Vicia faba]|uniref:Rx N-terminal domain-containing protein n=1 Tax=Vicia faba TaxID=3906 RepID=A0AAV1A6B1_VICFA|nr:unnamed protein product [Vicia faba]
MQLQYLQGLAGFFTFAFALIRTEVLSEVGVWLAKLREIRAKFKELHILMEAGGTATEKVFREPTMAESTASFKPYKFIILIIELERAIGFPVIDLKLEDRQIHMK